MEAKKPGRVDLFGGVYSGKGVGWPSGINSFDHPIYTNELQLRWMENAVTQGAFAQVRPGYKQRLAFDVTFDQANAWWQSADSPIVHPQMAVRFQPSSGPQQLVFAISGSVFHAPINPDATLGTWQQITGLHFNPNADQLVGVRCIQSATIIGGLYVNNIEPRNLLVIQDGGNRAGIWDGLVGVHMNPQKRISVVNGDTYYSEAWNQTRIGLWMAWSGNRLWIANGPNVYASDLNDPTHFTEELNLQSAPVFTFEDDVTGMVDRGTSGTSRSQVVVFTATTTETLWSGIQNRLPSEFGQGWAFTPDFRVKIFDSVGCVAGKSIIVHRGLLYWKSHGGTVLFDSTQTVNSSQNLPPIDSEMAYSKYQIVPSPQGGDLTCGGRYNNYVWWSVPVGTATNGRRYCSHTQVLDRQTTVVRSSGISGAFQAGTTGWQGVWTGIRPVEWANAMVGGQEATYALCMGTDGVVYIWQAMQSNRADNGQRIPWLIETRLHACQPTIFENGIFNHFRLLMDQLEGNVDVVGMWRGLKGTYHELLNTTITATPGSMFVPFAPYTPMTSTTPVQAWALQGRTVRSKSHVGNQADCNSRGVESPYADAIDHAFGLAIRVTGRAAISAYMMAVDTPQENSEGSGNNPTGINEQGHNIVPLGACPIHIDGTTPVFTAQDQQQQLVSCPYFPSAALATEYEAPTL